MSDAETIGNAAENVGDAACSLSEKSYTLLQEGL